MKINLKPRFDFDSNLPVEGEKPSFLLSTEGALILIGTAAAAALILVKYLAAHSHELIHWLMPSFF